MESSSDLLPVLERIAVALEQVAQKLTSAECSTVRPPTHPSAGPDLLPLAEHMAHQLTRLADAAAPPTSAVMGTPEIAMRLGCTTVWVAEMARKGQIPSSCIVRGTGNGKPWKFHRELIERWLEAR